MTRDLVSALGLLAALCTAPPATLPAPCPASELAAIEADYSAHVLAECKGYTLEGCPSIGALRAKRHADELARGCR